MSINERKQRDFIAREEDILSTALNLFQGEDWQSVTVARIAEEAGIGKGTVYKHFDSKEAIYAELSMHFFDELLGKMRQIDAHAEPVDWLRQAIRMAFAHYLANSQYRHVVLFCSRPAFRSQLEATQQQRFMRIDQDFNGMLAGTLARGVVAGLFPDRPVMQLAFPLEAAFTGAMQMIWEGCLDENGCALAAGVRNELEPLLEQLEAFMLAGLIYQQKLLS